MDKYTIVHVYSIRLSRRVSVCLSVFVSVPATVWRMLWHKDKKVMCGRNNTQTNKKNVFKNFYLFVLVCLEIWRALYLGYIRMDGFVSYLPSINSLLLMLLAIAISCCFFLCLFVCLDSAFTLSLPGIMNHKTVVFPEVCKFLKI